MLEWLDAPIAEAIDAQDPSVIDADVSWASTYPVPKWLDHSRELSERWIHRQQILEALGRPADLNDDLARPVLDGLRWAYPFRLGEVPRRAGTVVTIAITGPEVVDRWTLSFRWRAMAVRHRDRYGAVAAIDATTDQAWRMLTNNLDPGARRPTTFGDEEITNVLLRTRAIIGNPK